jgi:hypothetical protein
MPVHFLNADLDILSDTSLDALIDEIGDRALLLHGGPFCDAMPFVARYEMPDEDGSQSPETLILGFCRLISSLSPRGQSVWAAARERVIDLGYETGSHQDRIQGALSPGTMQQMAALRISLAWTFYPRDDGEAMNFKPAPA